MLYMFGTIHRWRFFNISSLTFDKYRSPQLRPVGMLSWRFKFRATISHIHLRQHSIVVHNRRGSIPETRLPQHSNELPVSSKTLQSLSEIYDRESFIVFVDQLPNSAFSTFLKDCAKCDFNITNNMYMLVRKAQKNMRARNLVDWAYVYQFRFNQSQVGILNYNLNCKKLLKKEFVLLYNLSYISWLLNTSQEENASQYVIQLLKDSEIPLPLVFETLLKTRDTTRLHTVFEHFANEEIDLSDELWTQILQVGLEVNDYKIVKEVYLRYIMKGFSGGRITLEEAVLSLIPNSNKMLNSLTNTLLMHVLQVLAMHGDTTLTIDLIESHFFHKVVAGGSALNKDLCVRIIESHCYSIESNESSFENILDLIDVFAKKEMNGDTISADLFQAMNHKFASYKLNNQMSEADIINPQSDGQALPLAKTTVLHDFVVQIMSYVQHLHPTTAKIFIDCLLNYVATYLNHSGMVQTLSAIHYVSPDSIKELNELSFNLILYSLSKSSSKRCASHYLNYMKSIGFKPSPQMYSWMINCALRGYYEPSVLYFLKQYYKDHITLRGVMKQTVQNLPNKGIIGRLKQQLIENDSVGTQLNLLGVDTNEDIFLAVTGPKLDRKYHATYDLDDLAKLKVIFPVY